MSNRILIIINNFIFTVSLEGYLIVIEKNTGNIVRINDVFNVFKAKKRSKNYTSEGEISLIN